MLVSRNVRVRGRRISVRLEQEMWDALGEICRMANRGMHEVCIHVAVARRPGGLTSSLRVFIMSYFRDASRGGSDKAPAVSSATAFE